MVKTGSSLLEAAQAARPSYPQLYQRHIAFMLEDKILDDGLHLTKPRKSLEEHLQREARGTGNERLGRREPQWDFSVSCIHGIQRWRFTVEMLCIRPMSVAWESTD